MHLDKLSTTLSPWPHLLAQINHLKSADPASPLSLSKKEKPLEREREGTRMGKENRSRDPIQGQDHYQQEKPLKIIPSSPSPS
jgi:hypothetical protein